MTHPDYRHQGVATALMQDAFAYARSQQYDLLLLHGIPDYYKQHGYIDVCEDMPQHAIDRALIPDRFSDMRIVRLAELHDAPALLALYQEHYGASMYTFAPMRTVERQVRLSQQVFTQLVFGFRPVAWAATQDEQYIPAELIPVLDILFPLKQTWIAGSDYF